MASDRLFSSKMDMKNFASVVVKPNEIVKVTPRESIWVITSVSLVVSDNMPSDGRVVVYAAPALSDGAFGEKIVIAPLRVGKFEVASVDLEIDPMSPIAFTTSNSDLSVTISGYTTSPVSFDVDRIIQ